MSEIWDIGVLWNYRRALWRGLVVTLELSVLSYLFGAALGLFLALLSMAHQRVLKLPAILVIETARVLPVIVVVVWIYYALPILIGAKLEPFPAAVIAFSFAEAAILAEVFRAGVQGLGRGQLEAGLAVGMKWSVAMRRIILPQAVMMMAPNLVNAYLGLLKWTSIASVIAVQELVAQGDAIIRDLYRPLPVYTGIALCYFALSYPVGQAARWLEGRYRGARAA
jgi:polar amino acid transport system permease protein